MIIWAARGLGLNLLGIVNLLLGILSFVGFARLKKKQNRLKNEQNLFE